MRRPRCRPSSCHQPSGAACWRNGFRILLHRTRTIRLPLPLSARGPQRVNSPAWQITPGTVPSCSTRFSSWIPNLVVGRFRSFPKPCSGIGQLVCGSQYGRPALPQRPSPCSTTGSHASPNLGRRRALSSDGPRQRMECSGIEAWWGQLPAGSTRSTRSLPRLEHPPSAAGCPRRTHRPREHPVRIVIVHESLGLGVPAELAAQAQAKVGNGSSCGRDGPIRDGWP